MRRFIVPCDLTKTIEGDVPNAYAGTLNRFATFLKGGSATDKDARNIEAVANKVKDYFTVIGNARGDSAITNMLKASDSITELDTWVHKYTQEKYDSFKSLLDAKDKEAMVALENKMEMEMKFLAAVIKDPVAIKKDIAISKDFKNAFMFQHSLIKTGNGAAILLNGDAANIASDVFINRSTMFKQYKPVNELYAELDGINNSTSNYVSKARLHVQRLIDNTVDDKLTDNIVNELIPYLDRGYEDGKQIITEKLQALGFEDADLGNALTRLSKFQTQWNLFNYGSETPISTKPNMEWSDVKDKNFKFQGDSGEIESLPNFLDFTFNTGTRLKDMIAKRTTKLDAIEQKTFDLFKEGGLFKIRQGYIPSSKNDILNQIASDKTFSRLYGDVSFLKQRQTMLDGKDNTPINFMEVFTNNVASLQHYVGKVSEYSAARNMQDRMYENPSFNEVNPVAARNIRYFADTLVKDYEEPASLVSPTVQSTKKVTGAFAGLVASTILMNSAPANYAAGAITMMARLGFTKPWKLRSAYSSALKDASTSGDIARETRQYFMSYSPYAKISDIITKDTSMKDIQINKVMDAVSNAALSISDKFVSKGIMGSIPGLRWLSFNESENKMLKISEALAYERINRNYQLKVDGLKEGETVDPKDFVKKYLAENSETIFTITKEAVGDFSKFAKPVWSWKKFRDAKTAGSAIMGGMMTMWYMFKQVEFVNAHVLNRVGHAVKHPMKNGFAPPASAGMAMGVVLLSFYEWLIEQEEFHNYPRSNLAASANPLSNSATVIRGLKNTVKSMMNMPVTEQEADNIQNLWRNIGGIPFGNSLHPDKDMNDGFKRVIDNFAVNMDFGYSFFKAYLFVLFQC